MLRDTGKLQRNPTERNMQVAAHAEEGQLRCLVEGHKGVLEAPNFEARPTTIKDAVNGGFAKATTKGYLVTMQEAGQGKADEAEAAWVRRKRGIGGKSKSKGCRVNKDIGDGHGAVDTQPA